jgi:hypothetical protein
LMCCWIIILQNNTTWSHSNKAQSETNWYREMSPVLFYLRSFKVNYFSLPTPSSFLDRVCAVLLFISYTLYWLAQSKCLWICCIL